MPRAVKIEAAGVSNDDGNSKGANIREQDVICGRSKLAANHAGNKKFQRIVREYSDAYQSSKQRQVKRKITLRVIAVMEGRFLRPFFASGENFRVEPASPEYIYEKVSHALRSAKKPHVCSTQVDVRRAKEQDRGLSVESAECDRDYSRAMSSSFSTRPFMTPVRSSINIPKPAGQTFEDHNNNDLYTSQMHPWQVSEPLQTPGLASGGTAEKKIQGGHQQQWRDFSQEFQQSRPIAPLPPLPGGQEPEPNISAARDDEDYTPLPFASARASKIDCDNPWFPHSPQPNCFRPQHSNLQ